MRSEEVRGCGWAGREGAEIVKTLFQCSSLLDSGGGDTAAESCPGGWEWVQTLVMIPAGQGQRAEPLDLVTRSSQRPGPCSILAQAGRSPSSTRRNSP